MKLVKRTIIFLLIGLLAIYFILRLVWYLQPKHEVNVLILDKTVTKPSRPEHSSFIWVLNNLRVVKPTKQPYDAKTDYMGFFPIDVEEEIFDFKSVRINQIETFAQTNDMAYYTDCYGVLAMEWYKNFKPRNTPKVYGGLNQNDYLLLKRMQELGQLVVGEYNMLGSPTNALIRNKVEELFNLSWSGWAGKGFATLDTSKTKGPAPWMAELYETQHLKPWPADSSGIVLVHNDGLIDLLLLGSELQNVTLDIEVDAAGNNPYNLPSKTVYDGWFEFVEHGPTALVTAQFRLNTTPRGNEHLAKLGLRDKFPAIVQAHEKEPTFYFAADFADNPTATIFAKTYGGKYLNRMFAGNLIQKKFFANFYFPLIQGLLTEFCPNMDY